MHKLTILITGFIFFLVSGVSSSTIAEAQNLTPQTNTKSTLLVRHLKKEDIKTLKIVNTTDDHIVITIKTQDDKSFRLKTMTPTEADDLLRLISEGKTIELAYSAPKSKNYILADNWQFN